MLTRKLRPKEKQSNLNAAVSVKKSKSIHQIICLIPYWHRKDEEVDKDNDWLPAKENTEKEVTTEEEEEEEKISEHQKENN